MIAGALWHDVAVKSRRNKPSNYPHYQLSPFAPLETRRARNAAGIFFEIFNLIKSGFDKDEPLSRLDRAIRIAGGVFLLIFFGGIFVFFAISTLKK